jgi:hypothetical protein
MSSNFVNYLPLPSPFVFCRLRKSIYKAKDTKTPAKSFAIREARINPKPETKIKRGILF